MCPLSNVSHYWIIERKAKNNHAISQKRVSVYCTCCFPFFFYDTQNLIYASNELGKADHKPLISVHNIILSNVFRWIRLCTIYRFYNYVVISSISHRYLLNLITISQCISSTIVCFKTYARCLWQIKYDA